MENLTENKRSDLSVDPVIFSNTIHALGDVKDVFRFIFETSRNSYDNPTPCLDMIRTLSTEQIEAIDRTLGELELCQTRVPNVAHATPAKSPQKHTKPGTKLQLV